MDLGGAEVFPERQQLLVQQVPGGRVCVEVVGGGEQEALERGRPARRPIARGVQQRRANRSGEVVAPQASGLGERGDLRAREALGDRHLHHARRRGRFGRGGALRLRQRPHRDPDPRQSQQRAETDGQPSLPAVGGRALFAQTIDTLLHARVASRARRRGRFDLERQGQLIGHGMLNRRRRLIEDGLGWVRQLHSTAAFALFAGALALFGRAFAAGLQSVAFEHGRRQPSLRRRACVRGATPPASSPAGGRRRASPRLRWRPPCAGPCAW